MTTAMTITRDAPPAPETLTRDAPTRPSTWNADALTVTVVLSSGAPVERYDQRGAYDEVLSLDQNWPQRIPLLDSHKRGSLDDRLGEVGDLKVVNGELVGVARLSKHNERAKRIAAEMSDGAVFAVSIGYAVSKWSERINPKSQRREKVAEEFDLLEASLVVIPADKAAGVRSNTTMPEMNTDTQNANAQTRAQINTEIRSIARTAGLDQIWIDGQVDADATLDAARAAALTAMEARTAAAGAIRGGHNDRSMDNPQARQRAHAEALYTRFNPAHQVSEPARQYVGFSTIDIARDCLRAAGVTLEIGTPARVIERALHSTSDFPLILGDAVGRTLREAYSAVPSGLKQVARQTTARDFKDKHRLQLSEASRLEKVNESGEFTSGTLEEAKESYRLATYGKIIGITRQALINDDLGAFGDLARRMGQAAAATEAQLLVDLLISNSGNGPTMGDSKTLFHADHKNKAGSGAAPSLTTLGAARLALRKQVGLSGELIDVTPRFFIVPPEHETLAESLMTQIAAVDVEKVNVMAGKFQIVVEPRFTSATRWYVSAAPATIDGLEYAYLEGEPGVQIETKAGFEVDGVQLKARLDFGAGFVDWRGWYANAGA